MSTQKLQKQHSRNLGKILLARNSKGLQKKMRLNVKNTYDNQKKSMLKSTSTPEKPGYSVHMDIFHLNNRLFISTSDRFSKYFYSREIPNKRNVSLVVEEILSQVIQSVVK